MWMCYGGGRHRYPPLTVPPPPSRPPSVVYPYIVPSLLMFPTHQPAGHPVVESAQHPPNAGGHDPCLSLIHHYWMDHRQVDLSQGPGILTLSAQNPHQTRHFFCACQSLLTTSGQSSSAIDRTLTRYLNELNRARGDPIGCDFRLIPQYCLLLRQATPLPLLSPSAEVLRQVPAV